MENLCSTKVLGSKELLLATMTFSPQGFFGRFLLLFGFAFNCGLLQGAELSPAQINLPPFQGLDWMPTALIFGLPDLQTRLLPETEEWQITLHNNTANTYVYQEKTGETLLFDGEVQATGIRLDWRFLPTWQAQLDIPYIRHSSGIWDDVIVDWHRWFGLPQGGRDKVNSGQFGYFFANGGTVILNQTKETSSLSDIRLNLVHNRMFYNENFLLQAGVKLPTGSANKLTGSGNWDASIGVGWQQDAAFAFGHASYFLAAGASYLGKSDLKLANRQKRHSLLARAGIHWHAVEWLSLSIQLDSHSAHYRSQLKTLGGDSLQITFGGHLFFTEATRLSISVGEDLNTLVTPDFVVNLGLATRF